MTKIFCDSCKEPTKLEILFIPKDKLNGNRSWTDLMCDKCHFIIATIEVDEPGRYEFVKVGG